MTNRRSPTCSEGNEFEERGSRKMIQKMRTKWTMLAGLLAVAGSVGARCLPHAIWAAGCTSGAIAQAQEQSLATSAAAA